MKAVKIVLMFLAIPVIWIVQAIHAACEWILEKWWNS